MNKDTQKHQYSHNKRDGFFHIREIIGQAIKELDKRERDYGPKKDAVKKNLTVKKSQ